jgi:hypothetical protein
MALCVIDMTKEEHNRRHPDRCYNLYCIWAAMRDRCNNPRNKQYKDYGGRGIHVCKRWGKFENFAEDMGPRPHPLLTLERKNNYKNYCKSNCKWASRLEQNNNRRPRTVYPPRDEKGIFRKCAPC